LRLRVTSYGDFVYVEEKDFGFYVVRAPKYSSSKLSLKGKLLAFFGLNPAVGRCGKHKLYYHLIEQPYSELRGVFYLCPKCFDEKFT